MGQVLSLNDIRKARGRTLSPRRTCSDMAGEYPEEIRAKLSGWVVELSAAIADLEKNLETLSEQMVFLPAHQSKLDLEGLRNAIVIEIYKARRFLAEL